jgi:hypothetical protein
VPSNILSEVMTPLLLDMTPLRFHHGVMELGQYVTDLQRQLMSVAQPFGETAGSDDARALAERLIGTLDAATRLVLLDALSAAAGEITRDLAPAVVDVRLRGREVEFVVTQPSAAADDEPLAPTSADSNDTSSTRTTLRIPDALKARVDEAASTDGMSVNTWLVRAIAAALEPKNRRATQKTLHGADHFAGWVR